MLKPCPRCFNDTLHLHSCFTCRGSPDDATAAGVVASLDLQMQQQGTLPRRSFTSRCTSGSRRCLDWWSASDDLPPTSVRVQDSGLEVLQKALDILVSIAGKDPTPVTAVLREGEDPHYAAFHFCSAKNLSGPTPALCPAVDMLRGSGSVAHSSIFNWEYTLGYASRVLCVGEGLLTRGLHITQLIPCRDHEDRDGTAAAGGASSFR